MLVTWSWILALGLLAGHGEAQSCTQAYGGPNLARGRPTSQSSTYTHVYGISGISGYAVDGKCDGKFTAHSCTHTNHEINPWWSVDLGREYAISLVVVKNRQDCCGERIQGATIHVGSHMGDFSKSSFICGTITDLRDGSLSTILCNGALGRYITIAIPRRVTFLSLGEVEVHGTHRPRQWN
ncbi:fucolectin-like [Eublepharis macularius]|uniref:Fucolectin-like n=1 Tax=Eublepharis macularius TaxID=481883 RepID=A0AA97JPU6_EUBMA|nr:fucolectin-like [Eublepharis macularius]